MNILRHAKVLFLLGAGVIWGTIDDRPPMIDKLKSGFYVSYVRRAEIMQALRMEVPTLRE